MNIGEVVVVSVELLDIARLPEMRGCFHMDRVEA